MANPDTPGNETTEYTIAKWTAIICAVVSPILGSITAFVASQPDPSDVAISVLGMATAAVTGVAGWASKIYTQGRTAIKVAKVQSQGVTPANPT